MFHRALCIVLLAVCGNAIGAEEFSRHCSNSGAKAVHEAPTLSVSTLNISHGRNQSMNQMFVRTKRTYENLDRIAALYGRVDADIVALQEADAASKWSGKFDHVEYLVKNTRYSCFIHGHHARSWLYSYGTALLSKITFSKSESVEFAATPPTTTKGYVRADFDWMSNGRITPVTVVSVHLDFSRKKVRDAQIAQMIAELSDSESELIIMGDLNSRWSDKRSHVRDLAEGLGLIAHKPESDELGSYKSTSGKRLDWILVTPHLEFVSYKVLPDVVADHLAIVAEIRHRGES